MGGGFSVVVEDAGPHNRRKAALGDLGKHLDQSLRALHLTP